MIGSAWSTVGLVAKVVGIEVASLAIGPCSHIYCTTTFSTAAAGQATRFSVQRASSSRGLALAEGNRRPSLGICLVNDQLIPGTGILGRCSTCGTPVGWQVSPKGIIILVSLATVRGEFWKDEKGKSGPEQKQESELYSYS